MKKNLTVSLDETAYRRAKVVAAQRGQSVSALVREYFESLEGGGLVSVDPEAGKPGSLLDALGDERLAAVDLEIPRFEETPKAPTFT